MQRHFSRYAFASGVDWIMLIDAPGAIGTFIERALRDCDHARGTCDCSF
jgi:hypothetical protein